MTRTFVTRLLLVCLGAGGLLGATIAPADAATGRYITARVAWGPMQCVELHEPSAASGRTENVTTIDCDGGFTEVRYFAPLGTQIGIDPVMGNNTFISCTVTDTRTGENIWSDYGTAGDGHDVNCNRTLTSATVIT